MSGALETPDAVVVAEELARWFGQVVAVTDVTVRIPRGIVGLLGPNGAGKSTLLRLMTGQIFPSKGRIRILGQDPARQAGVFRRLGYCSEDDALFETWTAIELVTYLARLHGYSRVEARDRARATLARTGLEAAAGRRVGGFSKGMRQRVRLAGALVHEPELLLLDEPMTGLDPVGRRDIANLIESLAAEGRSVIFASHILHEVEALAGHVVVISKGMVLAEGRIATIQEELADHPFSLEVACSDPRVLARALVDHPHVMSLGFAPGGVLRIGTSSSMTLLLELPGLVLSHGIEVTSMACPEDNLTTLFERLVR